MGTRGFGKGGSVGREERRVWECEEGGEKGVGVERGGIGRREWGGGVGDVHSIYVIASNILCVT